MNPIKTDLALLILRLGMGGVMLFSHGWGKLSQFNVMSAHFPDPLGVGSTLSLALAVFAEFFCALAVSLGILTRYTVLPLIVTMAVAAFIVHGGDPFAKKEMALLYLVGYVVIALAGSGKYSLDSVIKRQR